VGAGCFDAGETTVAVASSHVKLPPMSTPAENLVLEHLRHIRASVDMLREDMRDLKTRVTNVEENLTAVQRRLDRIDDRLDRVEKRLDLVDA
jgi:predicted nuclease with TOPRIM domain